MTLISLFNYVIQNDIDGVRRFLCNYSGKKKAKNCCLIYASALGNIEMVKVMLEFGIPTNSVDTLIDMKRTWEPRELKKLQQKINQDMRPFTRGWVTILNPACVASFYGHSSVLELLVKYSLGNSVLKLDPYKMMNRNFIGVGIPPSWNATTCALFGKQWKIANDTLRRGVITTDMIEQYPMYLEFRTRIPLDIINVVFSFL